MARSQIRRPDVYRWSATPDQCTRPGAGRAQFVAGTAAANEILAGLSVDGRAGEIHAIDRSAPKGSRLTCT